MLFPLAVTLVAFTPTFGWASVVGAVALELVWANAHGSFPMGVILLAGAALDVFEVEPPAPDNPVLNAANVVLSPHTAGNTVEAMRYLSLAAAEIVIAVLAGKRPENLLNPEVWERRRE